MKFYPFIIPPFPEGGGGYTVLPLSLYPRSPKGEGVYCFTSVLIPPLPEGGGGYTVLPLFVSPSKIFFVAFFSVTVNGRNLIFGHIGIPYCG
jgi:hypothetical protein